MSLDYFALLLSLLSAAAGLLERLAAGESLVVAEGYVFEFERRGYLKAGAFVPEVVLEKPELVRALHEEFVHAGSDVVLAFTVRSIPHKLSILSRGCDLQMYKHNSV